MFNIKNKLPSSIFKQSTSIPKYQNVPQRHISTKHTLKMPLVVPGINSNDSGSKTEEWSNKLVGKKIGDGSSDSTVWLRTGLEKNEC